VSTPAPSLDEQLAEAIAQFYADPLGFVLFAYPWGEPGTSLANSDGPDEWQTEVLEEIGQLVRDRGFNGIDPVAPIREAIASGHGIGKSTLTAWLVDWIMSTRPNCQGTVTANTYTQLQTKTWASIQKWTKLCITAAWFVVTSDRMYHKDHRESWFCSAQTCREENSEAFAGQHAADSTSFYIFDEASAVPDKIFEVAEGGLTDGEPMQFAFGNPTRSTGKFHRITFGSERGRWKSKSIDSRSSALSNKELIAEWIEDYGEDSDFVRVRVRGLPPRASDLQFIGQDLVFGAQNRRPAYLADDPLICALDMARGGADKCVFRFRRGNDAASIPPVKIPGEQARDSMKLVTLAAEILGRTYAGGVKVAAMFVDETGGSVGGPVGDRLRQLGHRNVIGVQFSGEAPDPRCANMRAYMWKKMREWLSRGAIDKDAQLETDLTAPGYHADKQDRLVLESKENMKRRGIDSPDDGDALAMTFAQPVAPRQQQSGSAGSAGDEEYSWQA
jgi:hypothetical protein